MAELVFILLGIWVLVAAVFYSLTFANLRWDVPLGLIYALGAVLILGMVTIVSLVLVDVAAEVIR